MGHPTNGFTGRADFLQLAQVFFKESIDGSHDWSLYECREKYKWRVRFFKVRGRIRNMIARNGVKIPTSRKNREKWGTRERLASSYEVKIPTLFAKARRRVGHPLSEWVATALAGEDLLWGGWGKAVLGSWFSVLSGWGWLP